MQNKTILSQIISGILKSLAAIIILVVIVIIIPLFLSIVKGKDIPPVDDSNLQLQTINIPAEENAFYDLDKMHDLVETKSVPADKNLVSDYLTSDEWSKEVVIQILADNEEALQYYSAAAEKGKFQLPYTDDPSKIASDMPVTPLNSWREASRLSAVKAIWLAKNGQEREALNEAFKSITIGNAIINSQSLLITYLAGLSIKDSGLDTLQKVISIIPEDSSVLMEYQLKLEDHQARGNSAPFIIEYLIIKQALDNIEEKVEAELGTDIKFLINNKYYYKKNLTLSYYYDFYNQLVIEANKDCEEIKPAQELTYQLEKSNLLKMYFVENAIGKYFTEIPELALNNILSKKCQTENKLAKTILMMENNY